MTITKDLPGFTLRLGPLVITWRSLFAARIRYQPRSLTGHKLPLFERPTVQEDEEPYRKGHARVVRFWPLNWAFMLGYWGDPQIAADVGESRALTSLLAPRTGSTVANMPVTKLFGPTPPEEMEERLARARATAVKQVEIPPDFRIIELDEDDEAHSG